MRVERKNQRDWYCITTVTKTNHYSQSKANQSPCKSTNSGCTSQGFRGVCFNDKLSFDGCKHFELCFDNILETLSDIDFLLKNLI